MLFVVMFALLASFHFTELQPVEASSCGTVYLYQAQCTHTCLYYPAGNSTWCDGYKYDHYTAPPANRITTLWAPTYSGFVNPTGCPMFCE